ncbi:MAG: bifunctional glycoside hydrolase 114/ polysaccharide deacetylase family protein, partial [Leptothrix sp. (in: b-proteobacteria)]
MRPVAPITPDVALYYGDLPPLAELAAFDWVVLDPGLTQDIAAASARMPRSRLLAYASVGEVRDNLPESAKPPAAWRIGRNPAWASTVIDQSADGWPAWFIEQVLRPQWARGFRGFFLDTLDSYQLAVSDEPARAAQRAGLVRLIRAVRAAFPQAALIVNRGFELLPQVADQVDLVAAESLYRRWNPQSQRYEDVPEADRNWLLGQLAEVRERHHLPALVIDYVAPAERPLARTVAARIQSHGLLAYVTNASHDGLGLGALEVLPRRVLMLHDTPIDSDAQLTYLPIHTELDMPVQYLGLVPEHLQVDHDALPEGPLAGRYAGIVSHFDAERARPALAAFLRRAIAEGIKVVSLGHLGIGGAAALRETYGIELKPGRPQAPVTVTQQDRAIGFEWTPVARVDTFRALTAPAGSTPLWQVRDGRGQLMDAIAYTPWGGYALWGQALARLPTRAQEMRWVVDPIEFLRRALALPDMPVPDLSTDSGRRMLMVHIDADGFANRSDLPGAPLASAVLFDEVISRYAVPTTVSVIEGETSPQGLYPQLSAELEATARRLFALPHVQIGSHTYSHPYTWAKAEAGEPGYALDLPGYRFDIEREVAGSIGYINSRLAPPGKRVQLFQWSGDCNPDERVLAAVARAGVLSINGGDTTLTRAQPTLTRAAPLGLRKGAQYQVYAPNQNENLYTELFTAPLYGYERVIESFELTERPRRLKPINVYFHTYSASRRAALEALHKVYRWALAQPTRPLHVADYVAKVLDFEDLVIARRGDAFQVRGAHALRELRVPQALGLPRVATSVALAGYRDADV